MLNCFVPLNTVAWQDCDGITPKEMIDLLVSFHLAAKVKLKAKEDGYPRSSVKRYFVPRAKPPNWNWSGQIIINY